MYVFNRFYIKSKAVVLHRQIYTIPLSIITERGIILLRTLATCGGEIT